MQTYDKLSEQFAKVINDFKQRSMKDGRELIIEPAMDSQILDVPCNVVEAVVKVLEQEDMVEPFYRAICTNTTPNCEIVEGDLLEVKQSLAEESCLHCGQFHDWDVVEIMQKLKRTKEE